MHLPLTIPQPERFQQEHSDQQDRGLFSHHGDDGKHGHNPPPYAPPPGPPHSPGHASAPPNGFRIQLEGSAPFPSPYQTGPAPFRDLDGSPVFFASAFFEDGVHPCKANPEFRPPVRIAYAGGEQESHGRYDLLPFNPEVMEFVPARGGRIPDGRRPVDGGYERTGERLYHGIATVNGVRVPGKTAPHLGGCNVGFGGGEHCFSDHYDILCWRH